ncbi:MFS transporter [Methylobacterium nodulans]|uniref:Major facilitator superfamily MFS_1 n=1 Tax=Methylobacterium nodulans (strain LMG 21967 / CNCM I-2342 / ORS 2060) TaxID=460265 RepID=B8IWA9_METNO|nr:MFS transporter [Methylobacterium nodulans]ACL62699.1 major facilitator superfamily MFS_1 [Methylobacterium nodulans ORS 2060]
MYNATANADPILSPKAATRFRWVVMNLIFVVYTLAAADRANIGIVLPFVKKEFAMSNTEAGAVVSLFFIGYSVMQIPAGFLVRKLGTRTVFPIFMLLTSLFTGLLGTAGSALAMKLNRLALGFAEAPLPVSMLSTMNRWFPAREKGTAVGLFLAAAKFGPVIVPPLGALIIATLGWQYVFFVCAMPGLIFAVLWYFLVVDDPARSRFVSAAEVAHIRDEAPIQSAAAANSMPVTIAAEPSKGRFSRLDRVIRGRRVRLIATAKETFRSGNIWGLALGYLMMTGIINVILAWLPTYLTNVKHFSLMNVGFVASAPFVGGVLGNIIGGWFSDRIVGKRRKPTILISAISTVFMMVALIQAPNEPVTLATLLFLTGFLLNVGYSSFTVYPAGLTTKDAYPLAVSVVNTGGQAGGALFPFLTGLLLDAYSWDAVFLFLGASSLVALAVMLLVVEPIETEPGAAIQ